MKFRTDYVSNSSSTSFILKDVGFFKYFGITKQDILDAIIDLYGGQAYLDKLLVEAIDRHEKDLAAAKSAEEPDEWHIEYHTERLEALKTKGLELFCVYDMTDEKERAECFKAWDDHFDSWYAPNEGEYHDWQKVIDILRWKCDFDNIHEVAVGEDKELFTSTYDRKTDKHIHTPFPGGAAMIKHIKRALRIKTMKEVLHDKRCTLMIHFDDNEVYNIKGMSDYGKADAKDYRSDEDNAKCEASEWDSENYSADRFFEILIKYFINKGKIDLTNPDFLAYWEVKDDDTWFKKNNPDAKYYLEDGKATWKDVVDDCLYHNTIMHEG